MTLDLHKFRLSHVAALCGPASKHCCGAQSSYLSASLPATFRFLPTSWFDCTIFILHNPTSDAATSAMERLKGKVAIVTGGGNGIGAAICQRLNAEGARVLVADVDIDAAKRVSAKLKSSIPWQACRQGSCIFFWQSKGLYGLSRRLTFLTRPKCKVSWRKRPNGPEDSAFTSTVLCDGYLGVSIRPATKVS